MQGKRSELFDSELEKYFSWWLDELKRLKYIRSYVLQPKSFTLSDKISILLKRQLKTKVSEKEAHLMFGHRYTPDVFVVWELKAMGVIASTHKIHKRRTLYAQFSKERDSMISYIEVKPSFDQHNMTRAFTINQKWIYSKFGIYVELIKPLKLFKETFTPTKYFFTEKTGKKRKIDFKIITISEYADLLLSMPKL